MVEITKVTTIACPVTTTSEEVPYTSTTFRSPNIEFTQKEHNTFQISAKGTV